MSLRLASNVQAGETVTASYAQTAVQFFTDEDNLRPANFTNVSVTNRVPATPPSAPAAPAAPTVSAVSSSRNLTVSWSAPSNTGSSAITGYEQRYYEGSSDPDDEADWITPNESAGLTDPGTATSTTISGLKASTEYRVQVRAQNSTGWGPWSLSGTGTTNSTTSTTNNAPTRMQLGTSDCEEKTADTAFVTQSAPAATQVSVSPITSTAGCTGTSRVAPMFGDEDGDTLIVTARVENLPDNVRLAPNIPFVSEAVDFVFFEAVAAFRTTDVRVDVTATDPHGASASSFVVFQVTTTTNVNGAPNFVANPGPQRFALNAAIQPLVLPAATGGDTGPFPYFYAVDGLPDGLTFDAATRKVSGTPTTLGTYTVTYTAEDAAGTASADRTPTTVDASDTARLTFTIQVGNQPGIERVRIVSKPQFDSDGDGTADTYTRGALIHVDVEFNEPVKVSDKTVVKLRLDMGTDDATLTNSHKVLTLDSVRHNGQTLRFKYAQVFASDTDTDGVWVQARTVGGVADTVISLNGATITHAVTGETADVTYGQRLAAP